ncbi:AAA family ATPase [Halospeciosus flavus]|uniref:AAA family ATPase n=1 Tax=Halospeciosus flavus TaxID=3032283 RepID=A0ABD5Z6Q6_9EURY|nr:MoxR family ATPase [Halospeciosus flavus]
MTDALSDTTPAATDPLDVDAASSLARDVVENVQRVIVGKDDEIEHLVTAILGRGHVLLEDVPGVGKTMLARSIARTVGGEFRRIQFTPDLLPADVTGTTVFDEQSHEFEFRPGPVFANFVLGDEINRASPKTQSALLEAMEEAQVTVDGETHRLPDPFVVVATQNAVENDGAFELPAAEVDRFAKRLTLGYPSPAEEQQVLERVVGGHPVDAVEPVTTIDALRRARATAAAATVSAPVRRYVTELANFTREHAELGVSPRGSIALVRAAQGRATLDGRDYVTPDDVQVEAEPVLAHRVRVESGTPLGGDAGRRLVQRALSTVDPET